MLYPMNKRILQSDSFFYLLRNIDGLPCLLISEARQMVTKVWRNFNTYMLQVVNFTFEIAKKAESFPDHFPYGMLEFEH